MANNLIKQYEDNSVDFRSFASKSSYKDLQKKFVELKRDTERLNSESYLKSKQSKIDFNALKNEYEKRIAEIENKIDKLAREN